METRMRAQPDREAAQRQQKIHRRLLALIAVILVFAALKVTTPVTLPLAFALFLIAVFWPLQHRLEKAMPRGVAAVITLLLFLVIIALFVGALWLSVEIVARKWPEYAGQFEQLYSQAQRWAEQRGLSLPGTGEDGGGAARSDRLQEMLLRLSNRVFTFAASFVLVIAFLVLGLLEVRDFHKKLDYSLGEGKGASWMEPIHRTTNEFQRYIAVRTAIGLLNGVLIWLFAWVIGLDFAFIWGLSSFLLNYIPTLGSIIASIPPALFALVQFPGLGTALLVLLGVGAIQLILGNYVDPLVQGKYLSLSPLVVLLSITFWGWLWGIAGALLSVPLTVVVVIACKQFPGTRWISVMLADVDETEEERHDGR